MLLVRSEGIRRIRTYFLFSEGIINFHFIPKLLLVSQSDIGHLSGQWQVKQCLF